MRHWPLPGQRSILTESVSFFVTSHRPQMIENPSGEFLCLILIVEIFCGFLTGQTIRLVLSVAESSYDLNRWFVNRRLIASNACISLLTEYTIENSLIGWLLMDQRFYQSARLSGHCSRARCTSPTIGSFLTYFIENFHYCYGNSASVLTKVHCLGATTPRD